jgi:hypothetical protein
MNSNKLEKIGVVYTCITGGYDGLNNHSYINPDWDYVCYTDNLDIKSPKNLSWQIRSLNFNKLDDVRNQRWHKIHPHVLFLEYERSVWVDANIDIIDKEVFNDIEKTMKESRKISVAPHPSRNCVYDELDACIALGKDDKKVMEEQIQLIKNNGFLEKQGLFDTSIIYREHHDEQVVDIMEDWWWWIEHYSRRDQLSLNYILWKKGIKIVPLSEKTYRNGDKVVYRFEEKHITKEELIVSKERLQQEINNLRQQVEFMKSSKFWQMRNLCVKIKKYLFK